MKSDTAVVADFSSAAAAVSIRFSFTTCSRAPRTSASTNGQIPSLDAIWYPSTRAATVCQRIRSSGYFANPNRSPVNSSAADAAPDKRF